MYAPHRVAAGSELNSADPRWRQSVRLYVSGHWVTIEEHSSITRPASAVSVTNNQGGVPRQMGRWERGFKRKPGDSPANNGRLLAVWPADVERYTHH